MATGKVIPENYNLEEYKSTVVIFGFLRVTMLSRYFSDITT